MQDRLSILAITWKILLQLKYNTLIDGYWLGL
jgi:hypothetical protein